MEIIRKVRHEEKTRELIEKSAKGWLYIVCGNYAEATRISEEANKMGVDIPFPLTFQEFMKKQFYGKNIKGFLISNADQLLQEMAKGVRIEAITINDDSI